MDFLHSKLCQTEYYEWKNQNDQERLTTSSYKMSSKEIYYPRTEVTEYTELDSVFTS